MNVSVFSNSERNPSSSLLGCSRFLVTLNGEKRPSILILRSLSESMTGECAVKQREEPKNSAILSSRYAYGQKRNETTINVRASDSDNHNIPVG